MAGVLRWVGLALLGVLPAGLADTNRVGIAGVVLVEEDRLAARALAIENEQLRAAVARLEEKQAELTVSLAEALAELDLARAREAQAPAATPRRATDGVRAGEVKVLDVNPALRMVVLDAGRAAGVEPGVVFAVVREGRTVARLRVVDVRERIAGAVLDGVTQVTLQRGDRAVLSR